MIVYSTPAPSGTRVYLRVVDGDLHLVTAGGDLLAMGAVHEREKLMDVVAKRGLVIARGGA